jgi:mono/diheme cytochrome c family protein
MIPRFPCALLACAVLALLAPLSSAADDSAIDARQGPRVIDPADHLVGRLIRDAAFVDLEGKPGRLSDYRTSALLVLCMTATDCPIARKYAPRLVELEQQYRSKDVTFVWVNSQSHESVEDMRASIERSKWVARYVPDPQADLAGALQATSTTEVFVLDPARTLVYRGAVDDQYGLGFTLPAVRRSFLTQAIDALLRGDVPEIRATTAPGCELALAGEEPNSDQPAATDQPVATDVTWHNRISRVVQDNCQICHRPGAVGPFELLTYDDVKDHAKTIKREVERRTMPPWFAEGPRGHWANDTRLSDEDRRDLLSWIAADLPEGDPKDAPISRRWPQDWLLQNPDVVWEAAAPVAVAAQGAMPYQEVWFDTNLAEDKWVGAIEIRNTHIEVVHHAIAFLVYPPEHPRAREQQNTFTGSSGGFAWMTPGWTFTTFPRDMAKRLPAGVRLMLQIHYTPSGVAVMDRPSVAVKFVGQPVHELKTRAVDNQTFEIPPGVERYPVSGTYKFPYAARIISIAPHSHLRGVSFECALELPDGRSEKILEMPRYDFDWQQIYTLVEPIEVPAGAILRATGIYDNSSKNPANPDPTKTVRYGQQSWDEMMIVYFTMYPLNPADALADPDERAGYDPTRKMRRWIRQHKPLAAAGALALVIMGAWFWRWLRARRASARTASL